MANSDFLRKNKNQHSIKNTISLKMDNDIALSIMKLIKLLNKRHPEIKFEHKKTLPLTELIERLSPLYPELKESFAKVMKESFIKPDGGFLYATYENITYPILIAEVKRQGTNDKRLEEGLLKQAKGNAIERLGKNLIAIRAIFKNQSILPFVCFGSGYDFQVGSTILDRVITMNDFFPLNEYYVIKNHLPFEPVTMFFRYESWSTNEMITIMDKIAETSIKHYFPTEK